VVAREWLLDVLDRPISPALSLRCTVLVRHPSAPPALAILAGVAVGTFRPAGCEAGAALLLLAWTLAIIAYQQRHAEVLVASTLVAFWTAGWMLAVLSTEAALHPALRTRLIDAHGRSAIQDEAGDPVELTARLVSDAARSPTGVRLEIETVSVSLDGGWSETEGGVMLTVGGEVPDALLVTWRAGRVIRLPALLRRPSRYMDPGVPDHELALARRGVALVGVAKSALLIQVIQRGTWLDESAADIRHFVRARVDAAVGCWDARSGAIVKAILLGDRAGLDDKVELRLQEAGTYHVLAISGGNVAILAGVMIVVLRGLRVGRRPAEGLTAGWLVFYAFLVGGGASVERATLMAVTYLVAHAIDHRSPPLNSLALAGGAGLALAPLSLFDPAFALTYGATGGILLGVPRLGGVASHAPALVRHVWLLFTASLSAEAALFPIGAFVFMRVTFAGLVLNFLAIPLMTVVQIGGIAALGLSGVRPEWAGVAGYFTHLAAWALVESAGLVQVAPWLSYRLPPPGPIAIGLYYAGWVLWLSGPVLTASGARLAALAPGLRDMAIAAVCLGGAWILLAPDLDRPRAGSLRLTFLDVGQGDAALIQLPSGRNLMVDAGGAGGSTFDIGQRVVEPVLWARGIRRVDYLVITHGDGDHLNGAAAVLRDFSPREVWEGVPVPRLLPLQELRAAADRAVIGWRIVQRGDVLRLGEVELQAWHPQPPEWERQKIRNDDSIVLEVRYRDVSIVLSGDIGPSIEAELARVLPPSPLRVLKVPHHGSATSSTPAFVAAVRPAAVVISVGRGNRFGHPAPTVVQRYRDAGARVFRTDQDGAVTLDTDGHTVDLTTFTGTRSRLVAPWPAPPA
jgi:competence protein ComEC